jgi:hypothetical protein
VKYFFYFSIINHLKDENLTVSSGDSGICAQKKNLHIRKDLRNTILPFTNKLGADTTFNDF